MKRRVTTQTPLQGVLFRTCCDCRALEVCRPWVSQEQGWGAQG